MFEVQLEELLKLLINKYCKKKVIIVGDLNVNFLNSSNQTKRMTELFKRFNFIQNIKEPTRITRTSSTCLDIVFTNFNTQQLTINVRELGLSDHKGVEIAVPISLTTQSQTFLTRKRIFSRKNISLFKLQLQCVDWSRVIAADKNVNQNYNAFHDQLLKILDYCIAKKVVSLRKKKIKPWLSTGLKVSCRNKRLLKLLILQKDSSVLNNYYKGYEKVLKKVVKMAKRLHNIKRMETSKNVTKSMWNIIKQRTNKINKRITQNIKLKINDTNIEKPDEIANTLNEFFVSVGVTETKNIPTGRAVVSPSTNSMYLSPVNQNEMKNIIKNLKSKSSFGYDEFPPTLIKQCNDELVEP